jgi:TrmH family RNA methyltransferase
MLECYVTIVMITSSSNPLVKRIRRLRQKKYRQQEGLFFAEGVRIVLAAVENGAPIETLVYSPDLLDSSLAKDMLTKQGSTKTKIVSVSAPVFRSISVRDNPFGLGAIIKSNLMPLEEVVVESRDIFVALIGVSEPGNLGTILRTIDACGASSLILVGQTVDPFHPTAVKASMGALFSVPISLLAESKTMMDWAKSRGVQSIATSARVSQSYWNLDYQLPALLLMGSERKGLPADLISEADMAVSIPMEGQASSLNLAVATGLMLYEIRRKS